MNYFLKASMTGASGYVGFNGAPLVPDPRGKGLHMQAPLNEWILPEGKNELEVRLYPLRYGTTVENAKVSAAVEVYHGSPADGEATGVIGRIEWPPLSQPAILPWGARVGCAVGETRLPTRLWLEAEKHDALTEADVCEIMRSIEAFYSALETGDVATVMALAAYRIADYARAFGLDASTVRTNMERQYSMVLQQNGRTLRRYRRDELDFRLIAGGRTVWASAGAGWTAIELTGDDYDYAAMLYLGKVSGEWRIVR